MIKKLSKSVREYKRAAIITPFLVMCEVVLEVLVPFFMAKLIDDGITKNNMSVIGKWSGVLIAFSLVALIFGTFSGFSATKASAGFAKNLRKDMYYNIQNFSFSNIDKFSTSSLVTRLTTDVTNVQMSFQMITRIVVRCPAMLIFAFVMSCTISWQLSMIFLAVCPILLVGLFLIIRKAYPTFMKVFKSYDKLNNVVQEDVRGVRVVKAYVREDQQIEKFNEVSENICKLNVKAQKLLVLSSPIMQFCVYLCMILISWFAAHFIAEGTMQVGELTSMFTYVMQILMSLMMFSMVLVNITMSKASAERICEVLNEIPTIHNPEEPCFEVENGDVSFENVSFKYSETAEKNCLENVNLSFKQGQTIGIIGGTGSSKTTLIQLISRLYDATEGVVKVGGRSVEDYDIESLRNSVAVVLQKNILFSGTIKDNMRWGNENATDEQIEHACKLAQADEFIQKMPDKYDTYIEQGGTNVSGGQKQRLCIARALIKNPKIIILDDSTSAVDTKTDALIRDAFKNDLPNTTKIIIAQRINSIEKSDIIVVMDGGKIVGQGTHDELIKNNEIYQEVFNSQTKGREKK